MKKFLTFAFLLLAVSFIVPQTAKAQIYTYKTTEFAYKYVNSYGKWNDWSSWEKSSMLITINFDTDIVKIYSPTTQVYKITDYLEEYTDQYGGKQVKFEFIDQDGDYGKMRLRIEKNGNSQIYIDFANVMWVYNVVKY